MSDYAIKVESLGKKYLLQHQATGGRYATFRDVLAEKAKALFGKRKTENGSQKSVEEFWALKDVSFEVKPGEVVGIIGRNGAGKSTLLKLLSRITEPTTGQIRLRGRVASLLEVGTGFHPELTGRENIFLNGAVLGMHRSEIKKRFGEIVDFAEVEKFLDTPVKRYSSGMYMRLAFAVAAHLEPEILIVDEVLAVGDAQFQKKCLGKMQAVSQGGRTILFVSHNMNAVQSLCSKSIVLKQGKIEYWGTVSEGLSKYSANVGMKAIVTYEAETPAKPFARIHQLEIRADGQPVTEPLKPGTTLVLNFRLHSDLALAQPKLTVGITNTKGERIFAVGTPFGPQPLQPLKGHATVGIHFTLPAIPPGIYQLDVGFYDQHVGTLQEIYAAGSIEVAEVNYLAMISSGTPDLGHILVRSGWTIH
ncbi:MAG: ABC transporter ATP-binding protein [Verrucomicrobiae bacterium]